MEARNLPDALKLIMAERAWSQTRLARELDISQSFLSYVLAGKKDTGFSNGIELLSRVDWEVRITPKGEESDPMKRREFNTKFAQVAAGVAFVPAPSVAPSQNPEHVRALTSRVRDLYYQQGSRPAAHAAVRYVQRTRLAMTSRDRTLKMAVSDLAREASVAAVDELGPDAAARLSGRAFELARSADSPDHQALALMELSRVSVRGKNGESGKQYAKTGLALPEVSDSQRAGLEMRLGSSLSMLSGQERMARSAIEQAHVTAEPLPGQVKSDIAGHAGVALAALRAYKDAIAALGMAAQMTASPAMQASWLSHQSFVALRANEPLVAAQAMNALAHVMPLVGDSTIEKRIRAVYATSAKWDEVPEVGDAREELREWAVPARSGRG